MKYKILTVALLSSLSIATTQAQSLIWTQLAHPDSLQVNGISFSFDGSQVLSGTNCHPAYIKLYNTMDGNVDWEYEAPMALYCMMGVGFSANGNYLASIEEMGNLLIFDYTQNPPDSIMGIDMGTTNAFALAFAPNSNKIAVAGSNGKLQTYSLQTGLIDIDINAHPTWVTAVSYSPDNLKIATGGSDNKVNIWDTTGTLLYPLTGHTDDITSVKFTPDNLKLISSAKDNTIKIWNANTGALIQTIPVSTANVNAIELSPDGSQIVSVSADSYIRIYDVNTYSLESSFLQDHSVQPLCVAWSPDGNKIVTGTAKGLVTLYDITTIGIADNDHNLKISMYPNPSNKEMFIVLPVEEKSSKYFINNQLGQIVMEGYCIAGTNKINIENLNCGLYYINIEGHKKQVLKIVKE